MRDAKGRVVREDVERRSAPVLRWLASRPRAVLPVAAVVLLVAGVAAPGAYAVPPLLLLALLLSWLAYLSWPALEPRARVLRGGVLLLVGVALAQRIGPLLGVG